MPFISTDNIKAKEILAGAKAKFIHTNSMTVSFWEMDAGAVLPAHSHFHEQVTKLISGSFELTLQGETKVMKQSDIVVIPPHAVHEGRAIDDCVMMDVFSPVREDYK